MSNSKPLFSFKVQFAEMIEMANHSGMPDFILLGFSEPPEHRIILFVCFLTMYLITLVANGTIIFIIQVDARLQTPMYFFLRILSFIDICLPTVTIPKLLVNVFSKRKTISFIGCFTQLYFFTSLGIMKDFVLAIMAVDRYLAISMPLHYAMLMSKRVCVSLLAGCWVIISMASLTNTLLTARLSFCRITRIDHYFCDIIKLFLLSCSDTSLNEQIILPMGLAVYFFTPLICITTCYILILITIWRMPLREGGVKAFSTCTSHLLVVTITYVPMLYTFIRPPTSDYVAEDRIVSVLFTIGCSMLNPFVYSIRNNEFKMALTKALNNRVVSRNK
ncbi:olfactory receptor 1f45-like [Ambystoma mexicanum]|uniref:olfactory receptor 1f45-like n=1 Tax=Ambystoma mexicanum TaxID=8296 RepID=UPI0037E8388A